MGPVIIGGFGALGALGSWFGQQVTDEVGERISSAVETLALGFFGVAIWFLESVWNLINATTHPQLDANFVQEWGGRLFTISLPILLILFAVQATRAAVTRRWADIGTAALGLVVGMVGTGLSLPLVAKAVDLFDGLADWLNTLAFEDLHDGADSLSQLIAGDNAFSDPNLGITAIIANSLAALGMSGPVVMVATGLIVVGIALLLIIGCIVLFSALLIRTLLLYVMVVIGPIMIAGVVFKGTRPWATKWLATVGALIFTKLGVVVVFGIGIGMLAGLSTADLEDGLAVVGRLVGGAVMLGMAGLVPIACFRFFDFLGESIAANLHGGAQQAMSAPAQAAQKAAAAPMQLNSALSLFNQAKNRGGSGGGGGGGAGASPQTLTPPSPTSNEGNAGNASSAGPASALGGSSAGAGAAGGGAAAAGGGAAAAGGAAGAHPAAAAAVTGAELAKKGVEAPTKLAQGAGEQMAAAQSESTIPTPPSPPSTPSGSDGGSGAGAGERG